jgi:hypothetical protein
VLWKRQSDFESSFKTILASACHARSKRNETNHRVVVQDGSSKDNEIAKDRNSFSHERVTNPRGEKSKAKELCTYEGNTGIETQKDTTENRTNQMDSSKRLVTFSAMSSSANSPAT